MKTKVLIAGIGAVGGYFGGLLAKHFYNSETAEISFFSRGSHLKEIQNNGLKVIQGDQDFIARPAIATDDPNKVGVADVIIIASKSYDLEALVNQLLPCIGPNTIILPLLNGVDSKERIKKLLPNTTVLDGCVYLVSRLKQAGVIEKTGSIETLYFGLDNFTNERLLLLESLFRQAGIQASLSESISTIVWEKFIFISPTATATSSFDLTIGELVADPDKLNTVIKLIEEVKQLAKAKQITVAEDIVEKTVNKLRSMPVKATSSMHSDFLSNKAHTELESLTGYVIREGQKYNLALPVYGEMYGKLSRKN